MQDCIYLFFFFQAEDGIRDLVRSRGLGDVYKRQCQTREIEELNKLLGNQKLAKYLVLKEKLITRLKLSLIHI
mgnify:CR=1 FL=1